MQQMHTHKAVTWRVEAKKLLPRRRQSEYRSHDVYVLHHGSYTPIVLLPWIQTKLS